MNCFMKRFLSICFLWACCFMLWGQSAGDGYGGDYNPTHPDDPAGPTLGPTTYSLTLVATEGGTVSQGTSGSEFAEGTRIWLYAYNATHYNFIHWLQGDSVVSTSSNFYYTMPTKDVVLTAVFEYDPGQYGEGYNPTVPGDPGAVQKTYQVSVVASPTDGGSVSCSSSKMAAGSSTYVSTSTNSGYRFRGWWLNGELMSTEPYYPFRVGRADMHLTATYEYAPTMPGDPSDNGAVSTYTLYYNIGGHTYYSEQLVTGEVIPSLKEPYRKGHVFNGWDNLPDTMPSNNLTVYGSFTPNRHTIQFVVNNEIVYTEEMDYGSVITAPELEAMEGYTFQWHDMPAIMPDNDVVVQGEYASVKYQVIYKVDGEEYKRVGYDEGSPILFVIPPIKEGYTFKGWDGLPELMPDNYLIGTGSLVASTVFNLMFVVDGKIYQTEQLNAGVSIAAPEVSGKEGYTFSGWCEMPTTMPNHDVYVVGSYEVAAYTLTYVLDGEVYKTETYAYGDAIKPLQVAAREGHTFSGWTGIPEIMPANDVTVIGSFTINGYKLTYMVDGVVYRDTTYQYGDEVANSEKNVPIPTKEGYTFSGWSEIPETMPANDVTVTGSFTINGYKLTYMVDGVVYRDTTYQYGDEVANSEKNVPIPTKEGYTFSGWSEIPETMPANDVIVTGNFILAQKVATPQSEVIYEEGTAKVILTTSTVGAVIYYTLDGSTPTTSSTLYNGAFYVKENCLLRAMAVCDGYNDSELLECNIFVNTLEVESPWLGTALNDGLSAYLYNPKAKAFLGAANQWGTQASFVSEGVEWLVSGSDGVYTLSGSISNGGDSHYFNGLWNDASATDFKIEMVGVNLYTIKLNGSYVAYSDATIVDTIAELTDGCYWQFVTKEERRSKYAEATAAEPVNATFEILGANFGRNDTNNSAWSGSPAVGGSYDNFCGEKWNAGVVEVSQVLRNMPSGKYRLSVQGFYRMGSMEEVTAARTNGTEVLHAQFFANDVSVPVMSILDEAGKLEGVGNSGYGDYGLAPNSMSEASQFFSAGFYEHSFLFTLGGGVDTIRLGVATTGFVAQDWVIFDNFRLEYLGEGSESDFFASGLLTSIPEGYHYVYYTDNKGNHHYLYAAGQNDWAVSDIPSIIKFSAGNTTDDPYATSASFMENNGYYMSNAANGDGTGPIKTELVEGVNGSKKRTWESQVFYKNAAGKYAIRLTNSKGESWGANSFVNIDPATLAISSGLPSLGDALYLWNVVDCNEDNVLRDEVVGALVNGDFSDGLNGWIGEMSTGNHNKWTNVNDGFAEKWTTASGALADIDFYQEIIGLPAGTYTFAAYVCACQQGEDDTYEVKGVQLYANDDAIPVHTINIDRNEENQKIGAELVMVSTTIAEGETLKVGMRVKSTDANWVLMDNAKLYVWGVDNTPKSYKLTYVLDGEVYRDTTYQYGDEVANSERNVPIPTKEGYTFSGWSEIPETMPANDVTVTGSFIINSYKLTYMVDGVVYRDTTYQYGDEVASSERNVPIPTKEGYTFKGWTSIPETMPANDVTVMGSFIINSYKLTYMLDGKVYKDATYQYGYVFSEYDIPIPTKEGHTFNGWEGLPEIMPAEDVTVTGSFTVNTYQVTYILDGEVYMVYKYKFGEAIDTPQAPEKEGYTFDGWADVPVTMPADNLTLVGKYVLNEIQTDDNGFVYDLNETKDGFALSDFGDNALIDVVVPEEIQGLPVTKIQAGAFEQASEMKTIVVPHSVTRVDDHAFSGCYNLQVVEWNADAPLKSAYFDDMDKYGNMLVFTTSTVSVNEFDGNVVIDGVAEEIVLTDGRPFNNPRDFVAHNVSFSREFEKIEKIGNLGGWRAMILPFDVQLITQLDTASSISNKIRSSAVSLPYWIAEVYDGTSNVFTPIEKITANRPFIIEIPNEGFDESFGDVVFSSENVTVHSTLLDGSQVEGDFVLVGVYDTTSLVTNVYTLNDEEFVSVDGDVFSPGSVFVESNRAIQPFEAYVQCSSMDTPPYYRIRGRSGTDIEDVFMDALSTFDEDAWYTLQGVRLNGRPQEKGLYIYKNQVVYVK